MRDGGTRATQGSIHFKEETISLCHPERSEGSLSGKRSFAPLRMTLLNRLRLTRNTSYLKGIGLWGPFLLLSGIGFLEAGSRGKAPGGVSGVSPDFLSP